MERVPIIFEDLTFHTSYQLLEVGKDDDELTEIAKKRGIVLPSKDLAIFKGRYALVDAENRNGCTLPKKEVKKALKTLVGKAVDKDHLRKSTIGHWLDAELDGDEIISYCAFWKSNFPEDFEDIKERLKEGKVKISFEAWGDREFTQAKSYNLTNIEFAGGAFLFETEPACPEAEVLEFARLMTDEEREKFNFGKEFIERKEQLIENARLYLYNIDYIRDTLYEINKCPACDTEYPIFDVASIDFHGSQLVVEHKSCGSFLTIDMNPDVAVTKKGKRIKEIKKMNKQLKPDAPSSVANIEGADLEKKTTGGLKGMDELMKKYGKTTVGELAKFLDETIETSKATVASKEDELATVSAELETVKADLVKVQEVAKETKDMLDAKLAEEKAKIVKARRDELTEEFAKTLSDDEIMDETKFELAKARKEIAMLKTKTVETRPAEGGLEAGASDSESAELYSKQKKIRESAFGTE